MKVSPQQEPVVTSVYKKEEKKKKRICWIEGMYFWLVQTWLKLHKNTDMSVHSGRKKYRNMGFSSQQEFSQCSTHLIYTQSSPLNRTYIRFNYLLNQIPTDLAQSYLNPVQVNLCFWTLKASCNPKRKCHDPKPWMLTSWLNHGLKLLRWEIIVLRRMRSIRMFC